MLYTPGRQALSRGLDSFIYTIRSSSFDVKRLDRAWVIIEIRSPIANDDYVEVTGSQAIETNVLQNDKLDATRSEVEIRVWAVSHGTAEPTSSKNVLYTPPLDTG